MTRQFTLSNQAGRVGFLLGVLDTMKGNNNECDASAVEFVLEQETEKRQYRRPCVAEHKVFSSTIEAAQYLAHHRPDLWKNSKAAQRQDAHAVMENLRNRVKNWCNRDDVDGYYWI